MFAIQIGLDSHTTTHTNTVLEATCDRSSLAVRNQTTLGAYIQAAHPVEQDQNLPCIQCDQVLSTELQLEEHVATAHTDDAEATRAHEQG